MDLADKMGMLSLKNASIQKTGTSHKTLGNLKPKGELKIQPKNFKNAFGVQTQKFSELVDSLIVNSDSQKPSQIKWLRLAVGNLNEILNTSVNFERQKLNSLRDSINHLDRYFKENSSQEKILLKKRVIPQTNKMLKSIESQIDMQTKRNEIKRYKTSKHRKLQKEFNFKKFSKQCQEERETKKETSFSEFDEYANCHFSENTNFLPPPLFCPFKNRSFVKMTHFHKRPKRENIKKKTSKWISTVSTFCNCYKIFSKI
jgi:hypothetical protein